MTARRSGTGEANPAHWLGYSAFAGWLAGPLLGAACWLARGGAAGGEPALGPGSGRLPLAGLLLVWALYTGMARSALAVGWGRAARWSSTVLLAGSAGWLPVQFLHLPTGGSINILALAWLCLTLPYPLTAACVYRRATRPVEHADLDLLHRAAGWLAAHRPQAIAAGCIAALVLGLALESLGTTPAHAAAIPVRSVDAEPAAPDPMLLLVKPPRGDGPTSYGYARDVVTISYLGSDASTALYDDLEVIVAPRVAASACGVDWADADDDVDAAVGTLACAAAGPGRWLAQDGTGNSLYIGEYDAYYVALAVNANSARPIAPSGLSALFRTLHAADTDQRALLNAAEDPRADD